MLRTALPILLLPAMLLVSGCGSIGYYAQSINGQIEIWRQARPIDRVLSDPVVPDKVKQKLRFVNQVRDFASARLALPRNESYTEYADLSRPYVVWNVFAAPELSLQPREWCFPIVGCVAYRGYFKQESATRFATSLGEEGDDVYVGGVPAYSTLGWFDDPVLSTVLGYHEEDLAGLIFHELAHQVAFAKGDTVFNESFATTVEREGVKRWLQSKQNLEQWMGYDRRKQRNDEVIRLILSYRERLQQVYDTQQTDERKRIQKAMLILELKQEFETLSRDWSGYRGFKQWFARPVNNAQIVSVAAYNDQVPAFQLLLARAGGDLQAFYARVSQLADQPAAERQQMMQSMAPGRD